MKYSNIKKGLSFGLVALGMSSPAALANSCGFGGGFSSHTGFSSLTASGVSPVSSDPLAYSDAGGGSSSAPSFGTASGGGICESRWMSGNFYIGNPQFVDWALIEAATGNYNIESSKDDTPDSLGVESCAMGNPVMDRSGNKMEVIEDYIGAGTFPLSIVRYYNGHNDDASIFGKNWSGSHKYRLKMLDFDYNLGVMIYTLTLPDGKQMCFTNLITSPFSLSIFYPIGSQNDAELKNIRLVRDDIDNGEQLGNNFTLHWPDGSSEGYHFATAGMDSAAKK
ncbi:MAG: DUF6531 domain-containing protein, partial [Psychrosphaera sp.]|nr:DUF6531 domain-containing protein [Psychrosphaera sp.]